MSIKLKQEFYNLHTNLVHLYLCESGFEIFYFENSPKSSFGKRGFEGETSKPLCDEYTSLIRGQQ